MVDVRYTTFFLPLSIDDVGERRQFANQGVFANNERSRVTANRSLTLGAGVRIPLIYGEYKVGAQIIEAAVGDVPLVNYQRLRLLFCFGYGPIGSIGGIPWNQTIVDMLETTGLDELFLDGNPIEEFPNIKLSVRHGTFDQDYLPGSSNQLNTQVISHDYAPGGDGAIASFTTVNEVDSINMEFKFPNGAFDNRTGGRLPIGLLFQYRFREHTGPGAWSSWIPFRFEGLSENEFSVTTQGREIFSSQIGGPNFSQGQYDIQVQFLGSDPTVLAVDSPELDPVLVSVTEYGGLPHAYPGMVLLELQDVVTNETNTESVKSVEAIVEGRRVPTIAGAAPHSIGSIAFSKNPALIALDVLTNTVFGLGRYFSGSNIDLVSFKAWQDYCDEVVSGSPRHQFNGVVDSEENAWTLFLEICRMSMVYPRFSGDKLSIVIDEDRTPAYLITQGSVTEESLNITWRSRDERFDAIEVSFNNTAFDYDDDTEVARKAVPFENSTYRTDRARPIGITNRAQAARFAGRKLRDNIYRNQLITFNMQLTGIALQPGDLFYFAHDQLGYGFSGRIVGSWPSTSDPDIMYFIFDRDITIVSGDLLYLKNSDDDTFSQHESTASDGLYTAGKAIPFDGFTSVDEPGAYSEFSYGTEPGKPYEVQSVAMDENFSVTIQALEFKSAVYSDTIDDRETVYSRLPKPGIIPAAVLNTMATNITLTRNDGQTYNTIQVSWQFAAVDLVNGIPGPSYCEVYSRVLGNTYWQLVGSVSFPGHTLTLNTELVPGATYEIAVVPVSLRGNKGSPDAATIVTVLYFGAGSRPPVMTGLNIDSLDTSNITLSWDHLVDLSEISHYELRYGDGWNSSKVVYQGLDNSVVLPVGFLQWLNIAVDTHSYPFSNYFQLRACNYGGFYSGDANVVETEHPEQSGPTILASYIGSSNDYVGTSSDLDGFTVETRYNEIAEEDTVVLRTAADMNAWWFSAGIDSGVGTSKTFVLTFRARLYDAEHDWSIDGSWSDDGWSWEGVLENMPVMIKSGIVSNNTSIASLSSDPDDVIYQNTLVTTDRYAKGYIQAVITDPTRYTLEILEAYLIAVQ